MQKYCPYATLCDALLLLPNLATNYPVPTEWQQIIPQDTPAVRADPQPSSPGRRIRRNSNWQDVGTSVNLVTYLCCGSAAGAAVSYSPSPGSSASPATQSQLLASASSYNSLCHLQGLRVQQ